MHGIGSDSNSMSLPVQWITTAFPGIYVKNIEIGNGYWDSFFMDLNSQVEDFCKQINSDPKLQRGFNLIGYSQGGLVTRGFVQRCDSPPVYNYITWSGPHGGQFGIPVAEWTWIFRDIWDMMYDTEIQDHVSFAEYWRDPFELPTYLNYSIFLADLNNEKTIKNETYRTKMMSLNTLVLLQTLVDDIVQPPSSGWFQSYAPNNDQEVIPLRQSDLYLEDRLGLKYLDEQGKLHLFSCQCQHADYPREVCHDVFTNYTLPFLNNTLPEFSEKIIF
jgi:palmitoyl-protein thioesterase